MIQHDFIEKGYEENKRFTAKELFDLAVKLFAINATLNMALANKIERKAFDNMLSTLMKMEPFKQQTIVPSLFINQITNKAISVQAFVLSRGTVFSGTDRIRMENLQEDIEALAHACERGFQTLSANPTATQTHNDLPPMNTDVSVAERTGLRVAAYLFMLTCFFGSIATAAVMGNNINIVFGCLCAAVFSYVALPRIMYSAIDILEEKKLNLIDNNYRAMNSLGKAPFMAFESALSNQQTEAAKAVTTEVETRLTPPSKRS